MGIWRGGRGGDGGSLGILINRATRVAFRKCNSVSSETCTVRGHRMNNNPCWKTSATPQTSAALPTSRFRRFFPLRFVHFKCQFDVFWPVIGSNSFKSFPTKSIMAPRNLQPVGASNNGLRRRSQEDCTDCTSVEGNHFVNASTRVTVF